MEKEVVKKHWEMIQAYKNEWLFRDQVWKKLEAQGYPVPQHLEWGLHRYLEGLKVSIDVDPADMDLEYATYDIGLEDGRWVQIKVVHDPWGVKVFVRGELINPYVKIENPITGEAKTLRVDEELVDEEALWLEVASYGIEELREKRGS